MGARQLVWPFAVAAATVVGGVVGLVVAVLVHGSLPPADAVAPVAIGVAAAVLVGVLVALPLRGAVTRAFPSLRRAPSEVARRIAEATAQRLTTEELLRRSAEAIRVGFDSPRVEIWLASGSAGTVAGQQLTRAVGLGAGTPPVLTDADVRAAARAGVAGEGWARRWLPALLAAEVTGGTVDRTPLRLAAVTESGQLYGLLVLSRPAGSARYDTTEDEALASLGRLLAAILRNRALTVALEASLADVQRTNGELRASRTRIVTAGDNVRRQIERDLHDGAQQHLLGLAVTLGLVRQMVEEGDPVEDIVTVLGELGDAVRGTIGEVRSLAQGIYPALLIDSGLEPALRTAAGRASVPVDVVAEGIGRYPAALEAALYFCCLEALQNASKHAAGATVELALAEQDGVVTVVVADTGPGFDPAEVVDGTGRSSMADRVGAHGGTVRWDAAPGRGTTVRIEVPVPAAAAR